MNISVKNKKDRKKYEKQIIHDILSIVDNEVDEQILKDELKENESKSLEGKEKQLKQKEEYKANIVPEEEEEVSKMPVF